MKFVSIFAAHQTCSESKKQKNTRALWKPMDKYLIKVNNKNTKTNFMDV